MPAKQYGMNPVAKFDEKCGDVFQTLDNVADSLSDEFSVVSVVNGGLYLVENVDANEDAYWWCVAEVGEGKTGAWDTATDKFANELDSKQLIIDELGTHARYLVEEMDD